MKDKPKYYTAEQISSKFEQMTKDEKIKVLYEAIDIMQEYNGRSRFLCIAMAMGYDNFEGKSDTYTFG
jgi:predicted metallopeptidase